MGNFKQPLHSGKSVRIGYLRASEKNRDNYVGLTTINDLKIAIKALREGSKVRKPLSDDDKISVFFSKIPEQYRGSKKSTHTISLLPSEFTDDKSRSNEDEDF